MLGIIYHIIIILEFKEDNSMVKIPSKVSIIISLIISVLLFICCIIGAFMLPDLISKLINISLKAGNFIKVTVLDKTIIYCLSYLLLAVITFTNLLLFILLRRVQKSKVFTVISVSLIRGISWCCFGLCCIFLAIGLYFQLSFILAFFAAFLGMCLRVVKNVIEEATIIKSENDLTV